MVELYLTFPNLPDAPLRAPGFNRIHGAAGATQATGLSPAGIKSVSAEDNQEQLQASRLLLSFGASRHCRNSGSLESLMVEISAQPHTSDKLRFTPRLLD